MTDAEAIEKLEKLGKLTPPSGEACARGIAAILRCQELEQTIVADDCTCELDRHDFDCPRHKVEA